MSPLRFRNVDAFPEDPVDTWPYEALVTAIDRGLVDDWQPIFVEIRRSPWGRVARRIERHLEYRNPDGVSRLFRMAIDRARSAAEDSERQAVVRRVRAALERSGLTQAELAERAGTSGSRLSTYVTGKVVPSATMLERLERIAGQ